MYPPEGDSVSTPDLSAPIPQHRLMAWFSLVLALWVAVTSAATLLIPADPHAMWFNLMVVAPIVVLPAACAAAYRRWPRFRSTLLALDLSAVTAVQGMRIAGIAMLSLWAAGRMTPGFALWAGGLDVFIGLTAVPLAYLVVVRRPLARRLLRAWHSVGILDFVIAIPLGLAAAPTAMRLIKNGPSTYEMFSFPLSFIPMVGVPFMIIMHGVAIVQLRSSRYPHTNGIVHRPLPGTPAGAREST